MSIEDLALKAGSWGGWVLLGLGGIATAVGKVLSAREAAKPDQTEQAGVMMEAAFKHLRAEMDRTDTALKAAREDNHRHRNALANLEAAYAMVLRFTRACMTILDEAGIDPPEPPPGLTIDEMMQGPIASYQIGGLHGRPVTDKDNGR